MRPVISTRHVASYSESVAGLSGLTPRRSSSRTTLETGTVTTVVPESPILHNSTTHTTCRPRATHAVHNVTGEYGARVGRRSDVERGPAWIRRRTRSCVLSRPMHVPLNVSDVFMSQSPDRSVTGYSESARRVTSCSVSTTMFRSLPRLLEPAARPTR